MATNSDSEEEWIMYKNRPDWSDLKPVPQNDGPNYVVQIAYSDEFTDVYDYFRGVVAAGELSRRALVLTEDAIQLNAANYTVWQYRRRILEHLQCDLQEELNFCRGMIEANPKNYQVWHHRRVIVGWVGDGSKELRLTKIIFAQDAKNYHAWEHRQWALRTFNLYDDELDFTSQLLRKDQRNNSAWNHRYFVLTRTTGLTTDVLRRELLYTRELISELQDNESPWAYIKGLLQDTSGEEAEIEACWRDTEAWCWQLLQSIKKDTSSDASSTTNSSCASSTPGCDMLSFSRGSVSPHLLIGLLDCVIHRLEKLEDEQEKLGPLETAVQICDALASTHDKIRCRYWKYMQRQLETQHGGNQKREAAAADCPVNLQPTVA